MAEYDIDLYINSKWIRKLRNNEDQIITEVTRHLSAREEHGDADCAKGGGR